jgi:uncharacterized protein YkwD
MLASPSRYRSKSLLVSRCAALVALAAAALLLLVAPARPAAAAVGNCSPDPAWGTPNATFAAQVVTLVNQHRQAMGLPTLGVSPTLTAAATWKSLHMSYYGYMQHDDPAPPVARTVADRLGACGYPIGFVGWGETIAYGYSTPDAVMTAWLNSPGHRANIENASYRAIGVGAARAANGLVYWTQDFGTLLDSGSVPPPPAPAAPTVALGSVPGSSTTSTSASFSWTTTGSPTSTTCSLDGAAAVACASPRSYSALTAGTHSFVVRVSNAGGSNSASYTWTITAPTPTPAPTPIPPPPGGAPSIALTSEPSPSTNSSIAVFAFAVTGTATSVRCSIDGAAAVACASPSTYFLPTGTHRFAVTAANAAGSSTATYSWTITP